MKVIAVATSKKKGTRKTVIDRVRVKTNWGLENDAHAGDWHRQVSLLALESIQKARSMGAKVDFGDYGENIVTEGVDLPRLPIGARLKIGETEMEITQIGKECHTKCAIFYQVGDCIMPREGVFAKVLKGGELEPGDPIEIISPS